MRGLVGLNRTSVFDISQAGDESLPELDAEANSNADRFVEELRDAGDVLHHVDTLGLADFSVRDSV